MATLSAQSLQSFTVAVGPGTTKELDTLLGTIGSGDPLVSITTPGVFTEDLFLNTATTSVLLAGGFVADTISSASIVISGNTITASGVAAACTFTGNTGANGLIVVASGSRLGFYGKSPVTIPAVTGAKAGNTAVAGIITALLALGLVTDSTT